MVIKVDYKGFKKLSKLADDTNSDWQQRRDCWIARQTILALAGKDCNSKIKSLVLA